MATKQPELKVDLRTSLSKFGGFLKVLAVILGITGAGATGSLLQSQVYPDMTELNHRQDSIIAEVRKELAVQEIRIEGIEQTNIEVKSNLVDISRDIKKLLYMAGKNGR